jgi:hypothetical protein
VALGHAPRDRAGRLLDTNRMTILPKNLLLHELVEKFAPERVASCHGASVGAAGFSTNPRTRSSLPPKKLANPAAFDWTTQDVVDRMVDMANTTRDRRLALAMANRVRQSEWTRNTRLVQGNYHYCVTTPPGTSI